MLALDEFGAGVTRYDISGTLDSSRRLLILPLVGFHLRFPLIPDLNPHSRFLLDLCIPLHV